MRIKLLYKTPYTGIMTEYKSWTHYDEALPRFFKKKEIQ